MQSFQEHQAIFSAYIRQPEKNPLPENVQPQRMAMYRELFFNNINGFLSSNFPVLNAILSENDWFELVDDFFTRHSCQTPHFSEIPEEFLNYLENERSNQTDLPFLLELAHYEWVEMAISIAQETLPSYRSYDVLLEEILNLSPVASVLAYQYPVHKISPQFIPTTLPENPTFLLVYRNAEDAVNFMELTPMAYHLLQRIQEKPRPVKNVLFELCDDLKLANTTTFLEFAQKTLDDLLKRGAIYI